MKKLIQLTVVILIGGLGCAAQMAVIGHEKHAYVVKQKSLGFASDLYFCDATQAKPICTAVTETP
jgi:hypothetical protein